MRNRSNDLDRIHACLEGRRSIQLSYGRTAVLILHWLRCGQHCFAGLYPLPLRQTLCAVTYDLDRTYVGHFTVIHQKIVTLLESSFRCIRCTSAASLAQMVRLSDKHIVGGHVFVVLDAVNNELPVSRSRNLRGSRTAQSSTS
jgi:hypothetical protein